MKVLFIVHAEKMFEKDIPPVFHYQLSQAIFEEKPDKIIVLCSGIDEKLNDSGLIPIVDFLVTNDLAEYVSWGWGYEKDMFDEEESAWIIDGSYAHEVTWIPPQVRDLPQDTEALLAGGFNEECLEDFRCVLGHLGIGYRECAVF